MTAERPGHVPDQSPNPPGARGPALPPDPLPADVEPSLRDLDARLGAVIRDREVRHPAPTGLADRVFEASVSNLPIPAVRPTRAEPARRPRWAETLVAGRIGWSHLAAAASLGLVFVIAAFFMTRPPLVTPPGGGGDVVLTADIDLGWLAAAPLEEERQVSHLLTTGALRSYDELAGELESMLAGFEM
jgi:hypothetical protein